VAGALLATGGSVPAAAWRLVAQYPFTPFTTVDRVLLLVFTILIGATVGLMADSGGTKGMVSRMVKFARTRGRAQIFAGLAGLAIFFDDYANCLIIGPAFLAVFAHHRLSRAKLAYIVDSTAAADASVWFVSTWIGYEVGLIDQALKLLPDPALRSLSPYGVFLDSIPFRFYLLFALALVFIIGWTERDFGPMADSERRALKGQGARITRGPGGGNFWLAVAPMLVLLLGTLLALGFSGRANLAAQGKLATASFRDLIGAANTYRAMFYSSFASFLTALVLCLAVARMGAGRLLRSVAKGSWVMIPPLVILVLAWALGDISVELGTGDYVGKTIAHLAVPWILPTLVFAAGAAMSFATGTSFGTMAILMPVAVPLAAASAAGAHLPPDAAVRLMVMTVGCVLSGSVFGDHCSIVSDTTILSALATKCDLYEHFKTQMPYAGLAGGAAVAAGTIPAGLGVTPWICLPAGLLLMYTFVRLAGRRITSSSSRPA
jgi:Na+/H+ antiporter NhaC